jgi:hypothetical protein
MAERLPYGLLLAGVITGGASAAFDLAEKYVINPAPTINSYSTKDAGLEAKPTNVNFHGKLSDRQIARGIEETLKTCDAKNFEIFKGVGGTKDNKDYVLVKAECK